MQDKITIERNLAGAEPHRRSHSVDLDTNGMRRRVHAANRRRHLDLNGEFESIRNLEIDRWVQLRKRATQVRR
jgi:hypothetical protein